MLYSELITNLRGKYQDWPKSSQAAKAADGVTTLFNLGKFPIIEGSYSVYFDGVLKTEVSDYTLNKDNGDLQTTVIQNNGVQIKVNFQTAFWRDNDWQKAINRAISDLNSRGFFRQTVRTSSAFAISANVRLYSAPSACIDVYEILSFDGNVTNGNLSRLPGNWSYQTDANKIVIGYIPTAANKAVISYLRNMQTLSYTSGTLDVKDDWISMIEEKCGEYYAKFMAQKYSQQGAATIDEGHFSFTNFRTLYKDCADAYEVLSKRKKPARPARAIEYRVDGGGEA